MSTSSKPVMLIWTLHLPRKSNFKSLSLEGDSTTYINFKHDKSKLHICMYFVLTDTKNWNRCPPFELENSIRSKGVFNMMGLFWIGLSNSRGYTLVLSTPLIQNLMHIHCLCSLCFLFLERDFYRHKLHVWCPI